MAHYVHDGPAMKLKMSMQPEPTSTSDEDPDPLDVLSLAWQIHHELRGLPASYVDGKSALRDAVLEHLNCSEETAEDIVDQMEADGLIEFREDREGPLVNDYWQWRLRDMAQ